MTRLGQNKASLKKTAPAKPGAKTASLVLADGRLKEEVLLLWESGCPRGVTQSSTYLKSVVETQMTASARGARSGCIPGGSPSIVSFCPIGASRGSRAISAINLNNPWKFS